MACEHTLRDCPNSYLARTAGWPLLNRDSLWTHLAGLSKRLPCPDCWLASPKQRWPVNTPCQDCPNYYLALTAGLPLLNRDGLWAHLAGLSKLLPCPDCWLASPEQSWPLSTPCGTLTLLWLLVGLSWTEMACEHTLPGLHSTLWKLTWENWKMSNLLSCWLWGNGNILFNF